MHGVQLSVGPIADEKGILILCGKFGSVPEAYAGGGTGTHVNHGAKGITAIIHEFTGTRAPPELGSVDDVVYPRGAVPGGVHVPFHIRIIGEDFSFPVDCGVVLVAESGGKHFPGFPLGIDLGNMSEWSLGAFHEILQGWKELVFGPQFRDSGMAVILRQLGLVAHHHVEVLAIRSKQDRVRTVLSSGCGEFPDGDDLVELVVLVGVKQSEDSRSRRTGPRIDHA